MNEVYTVGHSSHSVQYFIDLLNMHGINCALDVRSVPFSKYVPQFNKDTIKNTLNNCGIYCIYMGYELGIIRTEKEVYNENGYIDFEKIRHSDFFRKGIERILTGVKKGYKIVVMCTEKDPIDCHRSILIGKELSDRGIIIKHILEDGRLETQKQFEDRLIGKYFNESFQHNFLDTTNVGVSNADMLKKASFLMNRELGKRLKGKQK